MINKAISSKKPVVCDNGFELTLAYRYATKVVCRYRGYPDESDVDEIVQHAALIYCRLISRNGGLHVSTKMTLAKSCSRWRTEVERCRTVNLKNPMVRSELPQHTLAWLEDALSQLSARDYDIVVRVASGHEVADIAQHHHTSVRRMEDIIGGLKARVIKYVLM